MALQKAPEVRGARSGIHSSGACVALVLGLTMCGLPAEADPVSEPALIPWQEPASPSLELDMLDGERVDLRAFSSGTVIVHFFATWCEPCIRELDSLERLANGRDGGDPVILGVNVGETDARVRNFLRNQPVSFPILMDRERKAIRSWKVIALPSTFVLAPGLVPALFVESDVDWNDDNVRASIEDLRGPFLQTQSAGPEGGT